ncbi:MAG: CPBP family intramembrane metalloprotease [Clostridia bacterium]|nr:CPBP family intramembrane metalloprotease [Clostridia bacterium]
MKSRDTLWTPLLLVFVFALLYFVGFIPADRLGMDENPYLAVVVLQLVIYAVPALFYCRLRGADFAARLRLRLPRPGHALYLLYAAIFLIGGSALISIGMYTLFPDSFAAGSSEAYTNFARNAGIFDGLYLVMAFALLPAVTEELLFRGIVAGSYETMGVFTAVTVSSLAFAMSHFSFVRFPVYFFSGLVLAGVMYATRSLPASMLIHTLNNAFVLFLEKFVLHIAEKRSISMILFLIIVGFFTLAAALFMCVEAGNLYAGYARENVPSDYVVRRKGGAILSLAQSVFAPAFLAVVVLFVAATLFGIHT